MQTNINNLHENITKLINDNEITKSKMFSYENIIQNKEMFKSTIGFEADDFQAVFEFLDTRPHCENIKFYDDQNKKSLKVILKILNLKKKAKLLAIDQFYMYLSWLRNGFDARMLSWLFDIPKSTVLKNLVTWNNM